MTRRSRSPREGLVDTALFVAAVVGGWLALDALDATLDEPMSDRQVAFDYAVGFLCCVALWLRRRWPVWLALALLVPAALAFSGAIAYLVAVFTVGVQRPARIAVPVTVAHFSAAMLFSYLHPTEAQIWEWLVVNVAVYAAVLAWALFVRARRQLLASLWERAERAEAERELHAEQARQAERIQIAREMHDVLGHRVSLIALQAGGLEVKPGVPGDVARTAGLIRVTARQALGELRQVVGVLRADARPSLEAEVAPLPTLADIPRLVEDSRLAGARVRLDISVPTEATPPGGLARDAYRIVQEGLTNVHKHVLGAAATVTVHGAPGSGLRVTVSNPLPPAGFIEHGGGSGLVGLAERVALAGGTLQHGPTEDGRFVLEAVLAWPR